MPSRIMGDNHAAEAAAERRRQEAAERARQEAAQKAQREAERARLAQQKTPNSNDAFAERNGSLFSSIQSKVKAIWESRPHAQTFTGEGMKPPGDGTRQSAGIVTGLQATPQQAVENIHASENRSLGADPKGDQAFKFAQSLKDHKGDARWTQEFFRLLGAEKTAQCVGNVLHPGLPAYLSVEKENEAVGTVRDALAGLAAEHHQPPLFNQQDMDALVGRLSENFDPLVASELFGKMSSSGDNAKKMFFEAAKNRSLHAQTDNGMAGNLAAAATHVLGSTSVDNQVLQLEQLRHDGQLSKFIGNAMAGPATFQTFRGLADQNHRLPRHEPYARVDTLLRNVVNYGGAPDSQPSNDILESSPLFREFTRNNGNVSSLLSIPPTSLPALRVAMFRGVTEGLSDTRKGYQYEENGELRNSLSDVLMKDFNLVMKDASQTVFQHEYDGFARNQDKTAAQRGMEKFFESTLFADEPDAKSRELSVFVADKIAQMGFGLADDSAGADERFQKAFNLDRSDGVAVLGGMFGLFQNAAEARREAKIESINRKVDGYFFAVDIVGAFVPGVLGKAADMVVNPLKREVARQFMEGLQDKAVDELTDAAAEQTKKQLAQRIGELGTENTLRLMRERIDSLLPSNGEHSLRNEFRDTYRKISPKES